MKREIAGLLLTVSSLCAYAQNESKTVALEEVVVKAAKVIDKIDGQTIYPTSVQKETSTNGYTMLQKLALPNIRIDDATHAVSVIDNEGEVQLRINGIIVGKQEMISIDPQTISRINFIDNPGVRYGENIAYVIDIITRRNDSGYTLGADFTPALTTARTDGTLYGKWNTGKSELALSYDFSGYKLKGVKSSEVADYTLSDGSITTIARDDQETLRKQVSHGVKLTYNWADSTTCMFQASISGSFYRIPGNYSVKAITGDAGNYTATNKEDERSGSPAVDLYYFRQFTPRQSITANAVGTYLFTKTNRSYDEGTPYIYKVDGKSASVLSEVIYENRLKPFTLSSGLNYRFKYTDNNYTGDTSARAEMQNNTVYAFAEIKGAFHDFRYTLGGGISYIHYRQGEHNYDYWTFRPKLSVAYHFAPGMQLGYSFSLGDRVSRIAMVSDAIIRTNSMEWTAGNPDLKPNRDMEHALRFSYGTSRLYTFIDGYFKKCMKPNMASYERTSDDRFIYTQMNQKEIDLLHAMAYASYWVIPEKLQLAVNGGMMRCFNFGYDYTHCYTSWFYAGNLTAFLGKFSLSAGTDNGSRFLEGETRGYNAGVSTLQASYKLKDWQFTLTWANPLTTNYKSYESEILNRNLHKQIAGFNKDFGNRITLNVAWRINRGKTHRSAEKDIQLRDTDAGIMR